MVSEPNLWRGNDYRPAPMLKTRLYLIACIFIAVAVATVWLAVRLLTRAAGEGLALAVGLPVPETVGWLVLAAFVLVLAPLLLLVALLLVRWTENAHLRLAPEGIAYIEPIGAIWTDWQNVERIEQVRVLFTVVGGLRLRSPGKVARPRGARLLTMLQPLFVPSSVTLGDRFIPLTTLGVDLRAEAPLPQELRRRAPWLFESREGSNKR